MTDRVRDARPPALLVAALNPIMRRLLVTRLGRLIKPFALLEFSGRRTGRRYRVPTGLYVADGASVVFTPAPWRANFEGRARATVHHRGRTVQMTGRLITNPSEVALGLRSALRGGASSRLLGLDIPAGHQPDAADVRNVGRAMIQFDEISSAS